MSLYSGSQYTLDYTGDDIEGFQTSLDNYIKENQLESFVTADRGGTSFAFDIRAGNKKANMMALLKCSPSPEQRLPYQEYFKTI